jgi:transposase
VPGLGRIAIETIIAEIGTDMSPFPTAAHLVSWAGLAPRLDESAGKRRSTRIRNGAPWLKPALVQAGWAATRKRTRTYRRNFCASKLAGDLRKRLSPLLLHPDDRLSHAARRHVLS